MRNLVRTDDSNIASFADEYNRETNNLSSISFGGQTIEDIEIPVGISFEIPHSLKVTPKYRIILKQSSPVVISDGDKTWDDKNIYVRADYIGPAVNTVVVSILILRR